MTRVEDAVAAVEAGVDALGVNFVDGSRRRCPLEVAARIVEAVPPKIRVFGVFANESRTRIAEVLAETAIGGLQFHGDEPVEDLRGWPVPVLRAAAVTDRRSVAEALANAGRWRVLLDSPRGGGSGVRFEDALVESLDVSQAVIAGGLSPANVADVVRRLKPWGVDVAGGVEAGEPGVKERRLVEEFVTNARSA